MPKQKAVFYTFFKNVPYTDDEWEWHNQHCIKLGRKPPENRPNHSCVYGPGCYNETEARKKCLEMFYKRKAQVVGYSVHVSYHECDDVWIFKQEKWSQIKFSK